LIRLFSTLLSTDGSGVAEGVGVAVGVPGVGEGDGVDVDVAVAACVVAVALAGVPGGAGVAVIRIRVDALSGVDAIAGADVGVTGIAANWRPSTGTGVSVAILTCVFGVDGGEPAFPPEVHATAASTAKRENVPATNNPRLAPPPRRGGGGWGGGSLDAAYLNTLA
jgi:hypothetical protein